MRPRIDTVGGKLNNEKVELFIGNFCWLYWGRNWPVRRPSERVILMVNHRLLLLLDKSVLPCSLFTADIIRGELSVTLSLVEDTKTAWGSLPSWRKSRTTCRLCKNEEPRGNYFQMRTWGGIYCLSNFGHERTFQCGGGELSVACSTFVFNRRLLACLWAEWMTSKRQSCCCDESIFPFHPRSILLVCLWISCYQSGICIL